MENTQVVRVIIVVAASIIMVMAPTIGAAQTGPSYDIETSRMIPFPKCRRSEARRRFRLVQLIWLCGICEWNVP